LKFNLFNVSFKVFVILRELLLELGFLIFEVDACRSKLLPQVFHIDSAHREVTRHRSVAIASPLLGAMRL